MARPTITPRNQERGFAIHELFFSTTDGKGIILSGNDVFARVSGHGTVPDLIGKPHNIIRHPDMPRVVFKLLWVTLNAGKAFAGYVKNMAADGGYYWVMALIVPAAHGFLSIRFKPSSPYFAVVKELYAELLAIEQAAGDGPDAWRTGMLRAGEQLSARLQEHGFVNYEEFMRTAITMEMESRRALLAAPRTGGAVARLSAEAAPEREQNDQSDLLHTLRMCEVIGRQLDELFSRAVAFLELIQKLDAKSSFLRNLALEVHIVSLNGVISASRLGQAGGGLSVVTQNLALVAKHCTAVIGDMTDQLSLTSPLRRTTFAITAAKLQVEMAVFFARELLRAQSERPLEAEAQTRINADMRTLVESLFHSIAEMLDTLPRSQESIVLRIRLNDQLRAMLQTLSVVHVVGKIQAAHVTGAGNFGEYFGTIYDQLQMAKDELRELSKGIPFLQKHLPQFEHAGHAVQDTFRSRR